MRRRLSPGLDAIACKVGYEELTEEEERLLYEACTCPDTVDPSDWEGGDPFCPVHA